MTTLSDEILLAYADDELPPAERASVERRLAYDAEARDRLQAFTSTGQWLARAYDETLRTPPPADLVAAIRTAARSETAPETAGAAAPASRRQGWRLPGWLFAGPAIGGLGVATGIALMLALQPATPGPPNDAALIAATLETAVTGETRTADLAGEPVEITPIGTVRTESGGVCREFTEIRGGDAVTHGIACRTEAGQWRTIARLDLSPGGDEAPGFALAGGQSEAVFEALLAGLGVAEVVGPEAERALLADGWE